MFTTDLVNLYNRNIFKTSRYINIFQNEKCRLMRNLSLSMLLNLYLVVNVEDFFVSLASKVFNSDNILPLL